jgi:single-stranded DNA-binding protein
MSVAVLISGSLFKLPEQRTSQAGRRFVSATLKVGGESGNAEFWSVLAFGDTAGTDLMLLGLNERVAVQGSLKVELYTANDGKTKISRTCFADHVMALRQPPKERKGGLLLGFQNGTSSFRSSGGTSTVKARPKHQQKQPNMRTGPPVTAAFPPETLTVPILRPILRWSDSP